MFDSLLPPGDEQQQKEAKTERAESLGSTSKQQNRTILDVNTNFCFQHSEHLKH